MMGRMTTRPTPASLPYDALVVGAGISGLAAAYELVRRGARVLVLEETGVAAGQSAGLARIFRVAHAQPRMCALALEAREGWRRWESELGAGRLLGDEGLVVAGSTAMAVQGAAMEAAGARAEALEGPELRRRVPVLAETPPWPEGLWDPAAGSLRIRRALEALAGRLDVRRAAVHAVEGRDDHAEVRLAGGDRLRAGVVVLCAGLATGPLAATAGLEHDMEAFHHVRLTYRRRRPDEPTACLICPDAYGLPLGTTGRWALGLEDGEDQGPFDPATADAAAAATREAHRTWVPRVLPGLDPEPVDEIRCVSLRAPWLDARGDGFAAVRRGRVVAFAGANVMKFGPLVGERLARTVLDPDQGVDQDLRPELPAAAGSRT
jgi:sarcosine oxidase